MRVTRRAPSFEPCPCEPSRPYAECCGRWHAGTPAPTAEALMRSRYAAFVLCNEAYLLSTWHPSTRPARVAFDRGQKWLGLAVVAAPVADANQAEVEFIARYRIGGSSAARLHERSRFVLEAERWLYLDG